MQLISEAYKKLNEELHNRPGVQYGARGHRHLRRILEFAKSLNAQSVVDYGCGKGKLSKYIGLPCHNYDPAVKEFSELPPPADLVVCTDVLEHIEPECLDDVLSHMHSLANKGIYAVIATRPDRSKTLADGSNPHRIIKNAEWWCAKLSQWGPILSEISGTSEVIIWFTKGKNG